MKSVILAILATFISINTFAAKVAVYSIPLTRVEMVQTDSIVSDPVEILASDSDGLIKSQFEDSRIQIIWKCDGTRFKFVLLNKTNLPLTIDWDKIVYVDTNGEAGNVIHSGVKYNERNQGQLKTIVPKLAKLNDFLVPSGNCVFQRGGYLTVGGWQETYLFPCVYKKNKDLNKEAPSLIGKTMRIDFPITIGDEELNYTFYFELADLLNGDKKSQKKNEATDDIYN